MWTGLVGLVKDGCLFSGRKVVACLGCRRKGNPEKERLYNEL